MLVLLWLGHAAPVVQESARGYAEVVQAGKVCCLLGNADNVPEISC